MGGAGGGGPFLLGQPPQTAAAATSGVCPVVGAAMAGPVPRGCPQHSPSVDDQLQDLLALAVDARMNLAGFDQYAAAERLSPYLGAPAPPHGRHASGGGDGAATPSGVTAARPPPDSRSSALASATAHAAAARAGGLAASSATWTAVAHNKAAVLTQVKTVDGSTWLAALYAAVRSVDVTATAATATARTRGVDAAASADSAAVLASCSDGCVSLLRSKVGAAYSYRGGRRFPPQGCPLPTEPVLLAAETAALVVPRSAYDRRLSKWQLVLLRWLLVVADVGRPPAGGSGPRLKGRGAAGGVSSAAVVSPASDRVSPDAPAAGGDGALRPVRLSVVTLARLTAAAVKDSDAPAAHLAGLAFVVAWPPPSSAATRLRAALVTSSRRRRQRGLPGRPAHGTSTSGGG